MERCKFLGPVELTVPADPNMMLVIRLTTAGVLARSCLTIDSVDDMKAAAEEACGCLIERAGCQTLSLMFAIENDCFTLRASVGDCPCGCEAGEGAGDEEIDVIRCVLESMVDEVRLAFEGGRLSSIVLKKRLPA